MASDDDASGAGLGVGSGWMDELVSGRERERSPSLVQVHPAPPITTTSSPTSNVQPPSSSPTNASGDAAGKRSFFRTLKAKLGGSNSNSGSINLGSGATLLTSGPHASTTSAAETGEEESKENGKDGATTSNRQMTRKQQQQAHILGKIKKEIKEGDRIFQAAHKSLLEMEMAMVKLADHIEKHMHAMKDVSLYEQLISQDFSYFYSARGSPLFAPAEAYRARCTDHLRALTGQGGVFSQMVERTLEPIRAHLAALPDIKELIAVRMERRIELELYRIKVRELERAAGIVQDAAAGPALMKPKASSGAPSLSRIGKKRKKLAALTDSYNSMSDALFASIVAYVNNRDMLLNGAIRSYFSILGIFFEQGLRLHVLDTAHFLHTLDKTLASGTSVPAQSGVERSALRRHAASVSSVSSSSRVGGSSRSTRSESDQTASNPRGMILPLPPTYEEEEEDADVVTANPDHPLFGTRAIEGGGGSQSVLEARGMDAHGRSVQPSGRENDSPTSTQSILNPTQKLLASFDQIRSEAIDFERNRSSRRVSVLGRGPQQTDSIFTLARKHKPSINSARASFSGNAANSPAPLLSPNAPTLPFTQRRPSTSSSILLFNNAPFNAAIPFKEMHEKFSPHNKNRRNPAQATVVETTMEALHKLTDDGKGEGRTVDELISTLAATAPKLTPTRPSASTSNLDMNSHLHASHMRKGTIRMVNTAEFLQQHRADAGAQRDSRYHSSTARQERYSMPVLPYTSTATSMHDTQVRKASSSRAGDSTGGVGIPSSPSSQSHSDTPPPPVYDGMLDDDDDDDDDSIPPPPEGEWDAEEYTDSDESDDGEDEDGTGDGDGDLSSPSTSQLSSLSASSSSSNLFSPSSTSSPASSLDPISRLASASVAMGARPFTRPILTGKFAILADRLTGNSSNNPKSTDTNTNTDDATPPEQQQQQHQEHAQDKEIEQEQGRFDEASNDQSNDANTIDNEKSHAPSHGDVQHSNSGRASPTVEDVLALLDSDSSAPPSPPPQCKDTQFISNMDTGATPIASSPIMTPDDADTDTHDTHTQADTRHTHTDTDTQRSTSPAPTPQEQCATSSNVAQNDSTQTDVRSTGTAEDEDQDDGGGGEDVMDLLSALQAQVGTDEADES